MASRSVLKGRRLFLAALLSAAAAAAPAARADCNLDPSDVYSIVSPSVVQVLALGINPFLVAGRVQPVSGTGFFVRDGLVVTNYHVVHDARTVIVYSDGVPEEAVVIGIDPTLDVALLSLPFGGVGATEAIFAPAGSETIGQTAYALGFPLGLGQTISRGIVSGTGRVIPLTTSSWLVPMIQTDAAVSPGSSGGPLVDDCGRVLGMVAMSSTEGIAENIAFAIPSSVLVPVIDALADDGHVSRPWHGIYGQMTTPPILMLVGAPIEEWEELTGFLIETVEPGSAADRIGLRGGEWPVQWGGLQFLIGGDIITEVNGVRIDSMDAALSAVRALKVGQTIRIVARRDGGGRIEKSVVLGERPILEQELDLYRLQP